MSTYSQSDKQSTTTIDVLACTCIVNHFLKKRTRSLVEASSGLIIASHVRMPSWRRDYETAVTTRVNLNTALTVLGTESMSGLPSHLQLSLPADLICDTRLPLLFLVPSAALQVLDSPQGHEWLFLAHSRPLCCMHEASLMTTAPRALAPKVWAKYPKPRLIPRLLFLRNL